MVYLGGRQNSMTGGFIGVTGYNSQNRETEPLDMTPIMTPEQKAGYNLLKSRLPSKRGSGFFDFLDPNKNGVANAFKPVGSYLIHQGLPAIGEFAGNKLGLGKEVKDLASMGANELGNVTGLGLRRFKKGSPEARAHMARIRGMKRK